MIPSRVCFYKALFVKESDKKPPNRNISSRLLTSYAKNRYNQAKFLGKLKEEANDEKNISTFQSKKEENAWVFSTDEYRQWPKSDRESQTRRQKTPRRLILGGI